MDCGQIVDQLYGQNGAYISPKRFLVDEPVANIDYVLDFDVQNYSPCSDNFLVCWTSNDRMDPGHAKVQCQAFGSDQEQTVPIDRADNGKYDYKFSGISPMRTAICHSNFSDCQKSRLDYPT
jgi:hypothetical protein